MTSFAITGVPELAGSVLADIEAQINALLPRMADSREHDYFCGGPVAGDGVCSVCGDAGIMPDTEWLYDGSYDDGKHPQHHRGIYRRQPVEQKHRPTVAPDQRNRLARGSITGGK